MSTSKLWTVLKFLLVLFFIGLYIIQIYQNEFSIKLFLGLLMLLLFGDVTYKFLQRYSAVYASYMFNEKFVDFIKNVDKPRIFIYSVAWPIMILSLICFFYGPSGNNIYINLAITSFYLVLFLMTFSFLKLTWSNSFKDRYIPQIKKSIKAKSRDFHCKYSSIQLEEIFDGMIRNGYLEYLDDNVRKEQKSLFVKIFKSEQLPNDPQFDLKLVIADTIHFIDKMDYKIEKMTKPKWGKIFTIDNKRFNPGSMYATKSIADKTRGYSQAMQNIDAIFNEIH